MKGILPLLEISVERVDRMKRKGNEYAQHLLVCNSEMSTVGNSNKGKDYLTNGFMVEA
jgi:hypothetical protein